MASSKKHKLSTRCPWCGDDPLYVEYHDQVWGRPVRDANELFAKLCLDGQQAGLSWITILRKQENYYKAFDQFNVEKIARYSDKKIEKLLANEGIVRNRLKINAIVKNARGYLSLEETQEGFVSFLWQFVDGEPKINQFSSMSEVPAFTKASQAMSKALKKRGFSFVGETICYAFMQAVGMVNDHLVGCEQHKQCSQEAKLFRLLD